jgi:hypothetical protein
LEEMRNRPRGTIPEFRAIVCSENLGQPEFPEDVFGDSLGDGFRVLVSMSGERKPTGKRIHTHANNGVA